uniref:NADH dehydrogenase subunit 4L n=1 Tax=Psoroptes ovis TaxID=83912 RepID=A0A075X6W3_PSOOV|nr:NADH dehydrogenase subunit 4L [Psoroptes ovis]AIH15206.1 NADH dehydrogenase subunit 4L [Psoroptes ovis]
MMTLFFFMVVFYFYMFIASSASVLMFLLLLECMIFFCFLQLLYVGFSYILCLFFILVGVCMGAFSICVYVSTYRSKSNSNMFIQNGVIF